MERERLPEETFAREYAADFGVVQPCESCGFPREDKVFGILVLNDDEEPGGCPQCGREVDKEGRCMRWQEDDGKEIISIIRCIERVQAPRVPDMDRVLDNPA